MFKFFRRIRQNLLVENRFSRYMLYAIGEIILVVIGILIALQINNWNNTSILRKKEIVLLKELKKSLESDLFGEFIPAEKIYKRYLENHDKLDALYKNGASFMSDSLTKYFRICFRSEWDFVFNTAAFENIKSTGIDIISDETLRSNISSLYSYNYPNFKDVNQNYIRYYDLQLSPLVFDNIDLNKDYFTPMELAFLKQSISISNRFKHVQSNRKFLYRRLKIPVKEEVETLIHDIESNLQRLQ